MLFWKLTVKAKIYILIQRGKLRADRETTSGMLGPWSRECMKIKSQCDIFSFVLLNLWNSYENRDNVKFVGRSKHYLEISKTWERLVCSSLLRSSSAAMKIEMAGIYWPQANVGNFSWYWDEVKLLTLASSEEVYGAWASAMKPSRAVSLCKVNEPSKGM